MTPPPDAANAARRQRLAWIVAIVADALQIVAFPLVIEGWLSPANDVLDVVTALVLFRLLGWHPALLPSMAAKLVPGVDLAPTWTAAVGIVAWTRRVRAAGPAPAPAHPGPPSGAEVVPDAPAAPADPPRLPPQAP